MKSLAKVAREVGVDRRVVTDLAACGVLGEVMETDSGHFLGDEAAKILSEAPLLRTLEDIEDTDARNLLATTGLVVVRALPARERTGDEYSRDLMGFDASIVPNDAGIGHRHWWYVGAKGERVINEHVNDEEIGGQPFAVTVRGFVVAVHKIVHEIERGLNEEDPRAVQFDLEAAGEWGQSLLGCWLDAGRGPRSTYWPEAFRLRVTG